jgi:hypothetical protein
VYVFLLACTLQSVMREFPEARMAYGESDEYSFILHKDTNLYGEQYTLDCQSTQQQMPISTRSPGVAVSNNCMTLSVTICAAAGDTNCTGVIA